MAEISPGQRVKDMIDELEELLTRGLFPKYCTSAMDIRQCVGLLEQAAFGLRNTKQETPQ